MTKQQMAERAIAAAIATLESEWEDEFADNDGGEDQFTITIINQDATILASGDVIFER